MVRYFCIIDRKISRFSLFQVRPWSILQNILIDYHNRQILDIYRYTVNVTSEVGINGLFSRIGYYPAESFTTTELFSSNINLNGAILKVTSIEV